jgi:hypothetical protein
MKIREPGSQRSQGVRILKIISVLIISSMVMAIAMSAGAAIVEKQSATMLTGIVSDSMCGADHGIKAVGDAECTRMCVELGAQFALVVGKRKYTLQGHPADLYRFAGDKVRVKGRVVSRDTMIVEEVAPSSYETATGAEVPLGSKQ